MSDAAQFYTNRVLKDFKDKESIHTEWAKQWLKTLNELHGYVKQYHTTGLTWGSHLQQNSNGSVHSPPTSSFSNMQMDDGLSKNGVMSSINSLGMGATSHLKKVSDDMKVHKNPQLKEQPIERSTKPLVRLHLMRIRKDHFQFRQSDRIQLQVHRN